MLKEHPTVDAQAPSATTIRTHVTCLYIVAQFTAKATIHVSKLFTKTKAHHFQREIPALEADVSVRLKSRTYFARIPMIKSGDATAQQFLQLRDKSAAKNISSEGQTLTRIDKGRRAP